jgi:hypothetical protein
MQRDFGIILMNLEGNQLEDQPGRAFRLADACVNALLFNHTDEQGLSGEEKLKRFQLAKRIQQAKTIEGTTEVTAEEISLIKKLVAKLYGPVVLGPTYEALEREEDGSEPELPVV